jgi:hypothetical protein
LSEKIIQEDDLKKTKIVLLAIVAVIVIITIWHIIVANVNHVSFAKQLGRSAGRIVNFFEIIMGQ